MNIYDKRISILKRKEWYFSFRIATQMNGYDYLIINIFNRKIQVKLFKVKNN